MCVNNKLVFFLFILTVENIKTELKESNVSWYQR